MGVPAKWHTVWRISMQSASYIGLRCLRVNMQYHINIRKIRYEVHVRTFIVICRISEISSKPKLEILIHLAFMDSSCNWA